MPQILGGDLLADHVLLVVLEGITSDAFEQEFLTRSDGFYSRVKGHATYFSQYHATNLDSYTSLIAMLTSVQVPYRAYADEKLYTSVNLASNLPRLLRSMDFRTLFICTCAHQPFVPTRNDWDRVMHRGDLPSLDGWVSLGSSRMEAATEDRAGLPKIEEFVAAGRRSFVLHELVFGHTPQWRAKTGQTQLAYYDAYLHDLLDRLEARDLASRSLLVIVSDHGDRARAADAANYRVPLLIAGEGIRPGVDGAFRSHLDLWPIIISHLSGETMPPARSQILVVGSTERWVYGAISNAGESLFIEDSTGKALSRRGALDPSGIHREFQASLDEFGRRFGR
ncbi:MAG TPA: sulfatase-like hydrolase/transferase [Sedimentisphaerales bacterium]|nr:sulfatase-like hydrolase/transferase [Sedimentisphaerales bacterium]